MLGTEPGSLHLTLLLTLARVDFFSFSFFSFSRVSLCESVDHGTPFVEQIGLKLKDQKNKFLTSSKF